MSLNYDPESVPKFDNETMTLGLDVGRSPMYIICDNTDDTPESWSGVSFIGFGYFLPRVGDTIALEDGNLCEVLKVSHTVFNPPNSKMVAVNAVVYARRVDAPKKEA